MKLIIAGGRNIKQYGFIEASIEFLSISSKITEVCSGMASGVDYCGERWAKEHNIPIKYFMADWNTHGKSAGPIRNSEMADYADALLLVWDGESRGSADMLKKATAKKLEIYQVILKGNKNA